MYSWRAESEQGADAQARSEVRRKRTRARARAREGEGTMQRADLPTEEKALEGGSAWVLDSFGSGGVTRAFEQAPGFWKWTRLISVPRMGA